MELETTRVFVKVVEFGSFSKAAEHLRVPKSTVSRAVSRLEQETGSKLLVRTTRSLTLTAAGRAFFDTCRGPVQLLEDARKSLDGRDSIISGIVKVTAPEDLGDSVIAGVYAELSRKHPKLQLEFLYTDKMVDLVRDGFDLAVRLGKLKDSSLRAKRVGDVRMGLVASPKYLKDVGVISKPDDLVKLSCLTHSGSFFYEWTLKSKRSTARLEISPKISGNQMTSLIRMAIAGAGIALVPLNLCAKEIQSGRLERVLPEWEGPEFPVWLISPQATSSIARVKVVADAIASAVSDTLSI